MARRKTENVALNEAEVQQTAVNVEVSEDVNKTETAQEVSAEAAVEAQEEVKMPDNVSMTEIPKYVDQILTGYPNYEELYIDSKGGVYVKGTQQNLVKDAILYKNPYYKQ